jgi:hypothetical protein
VVAAVEISWDAADAIRAALAGEVPIGCRMVERAAIELVRAIKVAEAAERDRTGLVALTEELARQVFGPRL